MKGKPKRKDAIDLQKSKRHGKAVKRGMKRAKAARTACIKASSVDRGKTKKEITARIFKSCSTYSCSETQQKIT
jgi:hypothetical protein